MEDVSPPDSVINAAQMPQNINETSGIVNPTPPTSKSTTQNFEHADRPVVLIEPISNDQPTSKFFSNDLALSKALATSPFGQAGIFQIKKNLARNLLIVMLETTVTCVPELLSVTKIGSWNVKCRLPHNQTHSVGVIGPFGEDLSDADLSLELSSAGYPEATAERICKGKDRIKTAMFKVNFATDTLPPYIYLGYQRFRVDTFVGKPWQCFKCQRFCHNAADCKNPPRCVGCSGPHNVKNCPNAGNSAPRCCNCGGPHTANYGGCSRMKFETQVEQTRTVKKMSYRDAVKVVNRSQPSRATQRQPELLNPFNNQQSSDAYNELNRAEHVQGQETPTRSVATQTLNSHEPLSAPCGDISVAKLVELLSKVLCLCGNTANIDIVEAVTRIAEETFKTNLPTLPLHGVEASDEPTSELHAVAPCEPDCAEVSPEMMDSEPEQSPIIGGQYLLRKTKQLSKPQPTATLSGKITKRPAACVTVSSGLRYAALTPLDDSTINMQPSPIIGGQFLQRKDAMVRKPDCPPLHDRKLYVARGKNQGGKHKGSSTQDDNLKCPSKKK